MGGGRFHLKKKCPPFASHSLRTLWLLQLRFFYNSLGKKYPFFSSSFSWWWWRHLFFSLKKKDNRKSFVKIAKQGHLRFAYLFKFPNRLQINYEKYCLNCRYYFMHYCIDSLWPIRCFRLPLCRVRFCWFGFGLVSLFNGISPFFRLFDAQAILLEEQLWHYLTHSWEDKGVHTFAKGICPKVNVKTRLEYELAYYDSAVHRFNNYTTRTLEVLLNTLTTPRRRGKALPTKKKKPCVLHMTQNCI